MGRKFATFLLIAVSCYAQWPSPKSALDAYEFVQGRRAEARKLWEAGDPRGFAILNDALSYLDQPLVKDLAAGNRYLAARRFNIYYDFAEAYANQGKTRESLENLKKFADLFQDPSGAKMLEQNPHFESVRGDPAFQSILAQQRRFEHYWDSAALHTPFRDNLPDDEKLAGLSKFWSEVKYNFGYPEKLVELDWDGLYLKTIPKVLATKSTAEYYQEMMRLCARLGDGHTNVYGPTRLNVTAKPPMRTGLVEGHVMILDARSPSLEARDIRAGVEILEVDGVPAIEYARRDVEPYQSASTPQDLENRTFWYGFLQGPSAKTVRLKLRDAAGKEFERDLERQGYRDVRRIAAARVADVAGDEHRLRCAQRFRNQRPGETVVGVLPEDLLCLCHHPGFAAERRRQQQYRLRGHTVPGGPARARVAGSDAALQSHRSRPRHSHGVDREPGR